MILVYIALAISSWVVGIIIISKSPLRIFPVKSLGFIKITTFDRTLCKRNVKYVHPITKSVVRRSIEDMSNCIPMWNKVATR